MRRGAIGPSVRQGLEAGACLGDRIDDVEQVARRARQSIEPRHHQHVARAEAANHLGKLGAVTAGAADFLGVDLGAACSVKLAILRG